MLFVHIETGLLIVVNEKVDEDEHVLASGKICRVVNKKWLETEAGQQCTVATQAEYQDPQRVDVWTERGKIEVQRITRSLF